MSDTLLVMRPDGNLPVRRWLPAGGTGPGVLVVHEIFGLSHYVEERCMALAAAGYVVHAPDLYFRLGPLALDERSPSYVEEGVAAMSRLDWAQTVADTEAALDALRNAPEARGKVAMVGYCFGGGVAFHVASRTSPDALVAYYGSAVPGLLDLAPHVTCPSQHHWGTADSYFPLDVVEGVRAAVTAGPAEVEFHLYDGADHAFDNPHPRFFHAEASALARRRTMDFLAARLA